MKRARRFSREFLKPVTVYFLVSCMLFYSPLAVVRATPSGADVQYGDVSIQQNGGNTVVDITSNNAIINWADLDTTPNEVLQFLQQSRDSAVLNRIISGAATQFDGTLLANGRVFIVNPAGVVFGPGAVVNVSELFASSLGITNSDFLNGRYEFAGGFGAVIN